MVTWCSCKGSAARVGDRAVALDRRRARRGRPRFRYGFEGDAGSIGEGARGGCVDGCCVTN